MPDSLESLEEAVNKALELDKECRRFNDIIIDRAKVGEKDYLMKQVMSWGMSLGTFYGKTGAFARWDIDRRTLPKQPKGTQVIQPKNASKKTTAKGGKT